MTMLLGTWRSLFGGRETYIDKVLGYGPIAYWPLDEGSGTVAHCLVDPAQNGTYARDVSVMGTQEGIGDGNTAPTFDGANDRVLLTTAALTAAFNGDTGTLVGWYRVSGAGIWTDGNAHVGCYFRDGAYTNLVNWRKDIANNRLFMDYRAGGVAESATLNGRSFTTWVHMAITWDKPADAVSYYENGAWLETDNTLGVWAGITVAYLGADNLANKWSGSLAQFALFDYAMTVGSVAELASV